jgi:hypothetical protein
MLPQKSAAVNAPVLNVHCVEARYAEYSIIIVHDYTFSTNNNPHLTCGKGDFAV